MKTQDVLVLQYVNELIAINNERYKTYSRAMDKTHDENFRSLCVQNKERTVHFNLQLIKCMVQYNQAPVHIDAGSGKAYHLGVVERFKLLYHIRGVSKNACLWWDTVALKAYQRALGDLQDIPKEIKRVIVQQQSIQENDHKYTEISL